MPDLAETDLFILRRAFRRGKVARADVISAFGVASATASRAISHAEQRYASLLHRRGKHLQPRAGARAPTAAGEADLLATLDRGEPDARETGLFDQELPVVYVSWSNRAPRRPGVFSAIVAAIVDGQPLRIVHVGLRKGEDARWRRIAPLALERMADQWRVIAQDLELPGFPIRVFVLARILDVEVDRQRKPNGFFAQHHLDMPVRIKLRLNPDLNARQREAIEHELNIVDGRVTVASRSAFEFLRRYSALPPSADAVWPPIADAQEE